MDRRTEKKICERVVMLGNQGQAAALPELLQQLDADSAQVRRLAASALGKLAGLVDGDQAVAGLLPGLRDPHPQVRQYTIKALKAYGAAARGTLDDLRDIAANPTEKEYNQRDAVVAEETIREALRIAEQQAQHCCQRCNRVVDAGEYARSQRAFQRVYCDHCFDEVYLQRRNFDTCVENAKTITAADGTLVQSRGEQQIANFLNQAGIEYRYDERVRIIDGYAIRPDFYLPEFDLYLEYWGMDTIDYQIGMLKKKKLYQQTGKRLVSIYREDLPELDAVLQKKLSRYLRFGESGPTTPPHSEDRV